MQSIKNHLVAVLFFTLIISAGFARPVALFSKVNAASWYNNDWHYRKLFTVDADQVDENLNDFPIYLSLENFGSDFFTNVKSDGSDIVITTSDGTSSLSRELVAIDTGLETGELWFNATSLSSTVDTEFYIYYGNLAASETNSTDTWSNGYEAVHHLNVDPGGSAPQFIDSTINANNGASLGSMDSADLVSGAVGNAIDFDGINDGINIANVASFEGLNTGHISFWFKTTSDGPVFSISDTGGTSNNMVLWVGDSTGSFADESFVMLLSRGSSVLQMYVRNGHTAYQDNNWHHASISTGDGDNRMVIDGVRQSITFNVGSISTNEFTNINSPDNVRIGARSIGGGINQYFSGSIDELVFNPLPRSEEWISTTYNNQYDPESFYTVSNQETTLGSALTLIGITDNEWDGISQTEVCFEYFPSAEFAASDAVSFAFNPVFSSPVLDATPAEDDADGDTTTDGSFTSLTADGATYTFTDATTQATTNGINLCLDLPAGQSINSHSISMTDTNGSFGATLLHVADNNDVTVSLEITPTLSFNIRTLDDTADTNTCDLGVIDTTTLPNTDTTDDGAGECGYSLAIGTNATSGFQVQITSDGDMDNASSSIINATEDQSIAAGAEAYGLINITAAQTGSDGGGNFNQAITKDGDFADDNDYTPVPQTSTNFVSYTDGIDYLAGTDNTDVTQVMHGMTVGSGTPAGLYQQIVTYTTTVTF